VYQGKVYTYFAEDNTLFTTLAAAVKSKVTLATSLVLEAVKSGTSANDSFSLEIVGGGTAGAEVATVTETSGKIIVEVEVETTASTTAQAATAINTALAAFTMSNGLPASQVLTATGAGDAIAAAAGPTDSAGGTGIGYATPYELTGDTIPAAVSTAFAAGSDAQLREVNFTHQLASFLHSASTTWKTMIGCTSFSAPAAYDRESIAAWVGELPTYTIKGVQRVIDTSGDDGSGILGNKFLAGAAGYRNGMVEAGDAGDGYAFGGLIKTRGASLPNELSEFAYGILDTDEETDSGGAPVDLGKYVSITCDWVVHRNSYNGGSRYRGPVNASWLGLLATVPVNVQPIGDAGITQKIGSPPRIHATQHDQLVQARVNSLRRDPDFGLTFISARTAAHPDSDYTRVSSIRAVNRVVQGVRSRIKPFIGKDFTANRLISMKDGIDTYLAAERVNKIHQGAKSQLSFTKESRIIGGLVVKLRIVPPFAIEYVDVETSLAAEESDL
jgi:hypothetical protein